MTDDGRLPKGWKDAMGPHLCEEEWEAISRLCRSPTTVAPLTIIKFNSEMDSCQYNKGTWNGDCGFLASYGSGSERMTHVCL